MMPQLERFSKSMKEKSSKFLKLIKKNIAMSIYLICPDLSD